MQRLYECIKKPSLQEKQRCRCQPITFKVEGGVKSRSTRGETRERTGLGEDGGTDRVPLCWPDYALNRMSSHNKGFIITSWRVAAVWELRYRPVPLPGARKMWPSSASVGRFKQQQALFGSLSLSLSLPLSHKAACV